MAKQGRFAIDLGKIEGFHEVMEVLGKIEDRLRSELPKKAQSVGEQMTGAVRTAMPSDVFGLYPNGYVVKYLIIPTVTLDKSDKPVSSEKENHFPLFRIVLSGRNAKFADIGKRQWQQTLPKRDAADNLFLSGGPGSRYAYPAVEAAMTKVQHAAEKGLEQLIARLQAEVGRRRGA